jgi:hypothetical protein
MDLKSEITDRLIRMKECQNPSVVFPEGCYGSATAILAFVGSSPGGKAPSEVSSLRNPRGGLALWNESFTEPFDDTDNRWGGKYVYSIPILVESMLGISMVEGADKLYVFANFDWMNNGNERNVLRERMFAGSKAVIEVLEACKSRIIITLTRKSNDALYESLLKSKYELRKISYDIMISIPGGKFHRAIDIATIHGNGKLNNTVIVRSPQHPNRFLNKEHARDCAKGIKEALNSLSKNC